MGLIHIELFATLDLVGQSPGGPDEDPAGFPFGGWQVLADGTPETGDMSAPDRGAGRDG
jgi:hypothetical protein